MNETLTQQETKDSQIFEPEISENSNSESSQKSTETLEPEGKSETPDPSDKLILGKFKSTEDLAKAYEELQKHQGKSSQELGNLRKELADYNSYKDLFGALNNYRTSIDSVIARDKELYNSPEYLQNPVFKEIYSEALITFGENLDTDRLINLLEKYVETRISSHEKQKAAKNETQQVLDSMNYAKNPKNSLTPPKKSLDEMSDDEFKESLRKLI